MSLSQARALLALIPLRQMYCTWLLAMRFMFRVGVVYPAALVVGLTIALCIYGRGFAEIPYQVLITMETGQKLATSAAPVSGEVLVERCTDQPPAQVAPMQPVTCSHREVSSMNIEALAEHEGGVIRATYAVLIFVFALFEVCRTSRILNRTLRASTRW